MTACLWCAEHPFLALQMQEVVHGEVLQAQCKDGGACNRQTHVVFTAKDLGPCIGSRKDVHCDATGRPHREVHACRERIVLWRDTCSLGVWPRLL